uniref:Uncharacterized protein n=1 Tax=Arundo donax TaxID=35708 RepID=A0A0A9HVS8_ARUDO
MVLYFSLARNYYMLKFCEFRVFSTVMLVIAAMLAKGIDVPFYWFVSFFFVCNSV